MRDVFLAYACEILGATNDGLTGSQIVKFCTSYAIDYNADIPHSTYPFNVGNKRTALLENLRKFKDEHKFIIIKELCELDVFKHNQQAQNLKIKLISEYGESYKNFSKDSTEIEEANYYLTGYEKSQRHYQTAIEKIKFGIYDRNALDDLRLSLELLLKHIFKNEKSLENQKSELGKLFKDNDISTDINNMFVKLIEHFSKYQNNYVKHNDTFSKSDMNFILDFCSLFMKHIIRADKKL